MSGSSTTLALPGQHAPAVTVTAGMAKLDPRLLAALQAAKVPDDVCDNMGNKGIESMSLFAHLAKTDEAFDKLCKDFLGIDPDARPQEILTRGKLSTVWEVCRTQSQVDTKAAAERSALRLPPQLAVGDLETAKAAYEAVEQMELPDHLCPSEPYFAKKVQHATEWWEAESLMQVTSKSQEKVHSQPSAWGFDSISGTYKQTRKEFVIPMPQNPEELRARLDVMSVTIQLVKLRFGSNPRLATATDAMFTRYSKYLTGPKVWGFVTKDSTGLPVSSPHVGHVTGYDEGMRESAARDMNRGMDIQKAFEKALTDSDLRHEKFMGAVTIEVGTPLCKALTAPGLAEIYPQLRGTKRSAPEQARPPPPQTSTLGGAGLAIGDSPSAKSERNRRKKANNKANKAAKAAAAGGGGAGPGAGRRGGKGGGPGGGAAPPPAPGTGPGWQRLPGGGGAPTGPGGAPVKGAGKGTLPTGAHDKTAAGERICWGWNKGTCARGAACTFKHICWYCEGNHMGKNHGNGGGAPAGAGVGDLNG